MSAPTADRTPTARTVEPLPGPAPEPDAGERGSLTIDRGVLRKITEHAADEATGTARTRRKHAASAKLSGPDRELRIRLELAVRYPEPVRETVRAVREKVREELSRLAGCGVLDVEITVSALLPAAQRDRVE